MNSIFKLSKYFVFIFIYHYLNINNVKSSEQIENNNCGLYVTFNNYGCSITVPDDDFSNIINHIKDEVSFEYPVIDIGCGFGCHIRQLVNYGYSNAYGIDLDKKNFEYILNKENIKFIEGNFVNQKVYEQLPENDWGITVAINVFHFMTEEDLNFSINYIANHLKKSGYLIFSADLYNNHASNVKVNKLYQERQHLYKYYSFDFYKTLIENSGLKLKYYKINNGSLMCIACKDR